MQFLNIVQKSEEWFKLKAGKISGTRFGQAISSRENSLMYEMLNEIISGNVEPEDYVSEEMQYGIDNEDYAIDLYEEKTGLKFIRGGVILSDYSAIHMASPDAHNADNQNHVIVVETKCTMNPVIQIKRFFKGVDSNYKPQCTNYFAVSDDVKEVHFVSYCGFFPMRPLVIHILKREDFVAEIEKGRKAIAKIAKDIESDYEQLVPSEMVF